jgi:hypothetical protein
MLPGRKTHSNSSNDDDEAKVEEEAMHIELQATDSSGSSSYEEEEDGNNKTTSEPQTTDVMEDLETQKITEVFPTTTPPPPTIIRRRSLSMRQKIALAIGIVPVCIFALEMIPERCQVCLEDVELDAYFFTAAICGGLAAVLFGREDYWMARFFGGSLSALGSLFTIWMLLQSIPSNLAFLFVFIGILGAMPGFVAYFIVKILSDECYVSDFDDYDELAPLTRLVVHHRSSQD